MKTIIPGDNKSKKNRLIGFLSILCSVFSIIIIGMWVLWFAFAFDLPSGYLDTMPPVQKMFSNAMGVMLIGTIIGTLVAALLLIIGGFAIIWKPGEQAISRIGAYVGLASGIGMLMVSCLSIPVSMTFLSTIDAILRAAFLSIAPIIYVTFPILILILLRRSRKVETIPEKDSHGVR